MKKWILLISLLLPGIGRSATFDVFTSTKFGTYVAPCSGYFEPISTWTFQVGIATATNLNTCRTNTDVWTQLEPSEEVFNFTTLDQEVAISTGAGQLFLMTLPIYNQVWSQKGCADTHCPHTVMLQYYQFVKRLVQHYKGVITYWEIWNEPNLANAWNGEANPVADEYLEILKTASRAIREVDPTSTILLGGLAFPESQTAYLDRLLKLGGGSYFDKYNIHTYGSNSDPSAIDALNNTNAEMVKWNASKPIWITETNGTAGHFTDTNPPGTETKKAAYLVENFAIYLSTSNVERIIFHALRGCGQEIGVSPNYDFGMYDFNMSTLPVANAWKFFQNRLFGYTPHSPVSSTAFNNYQFTKVGGNDRYVLWPTTTSATGASPGSYSSVAVTDMFGVTTTTFTAATFPSVVFYSTGPVFLEGIP